MLEEGLFKDSERRYRYTILRSAREREQLPELRHRCHRNPASRDGLLLLKQRCLAVGADICRQRQSRECVLHQRWTRVMSKLPADDLQTRT